MKNWLTNAETAQAASVGRVRVSSDHEQAGEGVVLQDDLMNDAGARLPESNAVFSARRLQELVHLLVEILVGYVTVVYLVVHG